MASTHSRNPRLGVPPPTPSFGVPLPQTANTGLVGAKGISSKVKNDQRPKAKRLGLVPDSAESSGSEEDIDDEAAYASSDKHGP
jgi:hypothetical protein